MMFYFECQHCGQAPHIVQFHTYEGIAVNVSQVKCTYCSSLPFKLKYKKEDGIEKGEKVPADFKPTDL